MACTSNEFVSLDDFGLPIFDSEARLTNVEELVLVLSAVFNCNIHLYNHVGTSGASNKCLVVREGTMHILGTQIDV